MLYPLSYERKYRWTTYYTQSWRSLLAPTTIRSWFSLSCHWPKSCQLSEYNTGVKGHVMGRLRQTKLPRWYRKHRAIASGISLALSVLTANGVLYLVMAEDYRLSSGFVFGEALGGGIICWALTAARESDKRRGLP